MFIVGGCSFTDKEFSKCARPKIEEFKSWPEVIAEKTGKKVINTAKSGSGNRRIYQTVLNEIFKHDNVEQVIVAWSEWTRQDFLVKHGKMGDGWHSVVPRLRDERDEITKVKVFTSNVLTEFYRSAFGENCDFPLPKQIIDENMNYFYSLYSVCKERNIKLKMFQMLYPVNTFLGEFESQMYHRLFIKEVLAHPLILELDGSFWGWPIFEDLGGQNVQTHLKKRNLFECVSHIDRHPDANTHKNIAKFIEENL